MSKYIITDGERFIYRSHSSKFVPTSSEVMADIYTKSGQMVFVKILYLKR